MGIATYYQRKTKNGFTIVELLISIVVLVILATIVIAAYDPLGAKQKAQQDRANNELPTIANALKLYIYNNNGYPPETGDTVLPADLIQYINADSNVGLPKGPWANSTYYYDAWNIQNNGVGAPDTYQISIRFCTSSDTASTCSNNAPSATWASGFNSWQNAYYYCIQGYCRPGGPGTATTVPGYCINCANNQGVKYSGEP